MSRGIYAADTDVAPEKSMSELRQVLKRYGGEEGFAYLDTPQAEVVAWKIGGRSYRFTIAKPCHYDFAESEAGRLRTAAQIAAAMAQAHRQRWRAVVLIVKAALEGSEALGIPADSALLPYLVLEGGKTVMESAPNLEAITARGWAALLEGKDETK